MRLDLVGDNLLEKALNGAGLLPGPVVLATWGPLFARAIVVALKLGVLQAIDGGKRSPEDIAKETNTDLGGIRVLLTALNGAGLLSRRNGEFELSSGTRRWLSSTSSWNITPALAFAEDIERMSRNMEDALRTGQRQNIHHLEHPPGFWRRYIEGLSALAKIPAAEIARKIRFSGKPKRLLDVGGGHGAFSMALCKRHPDLQAEILDLKDAAAIGRELVEKAGMAGRVSYREGDLRTSPWGEGYDGVLLFNILHNLSEDESKAALSQAYAALKPGGVVVVFDGEHAGGTGNMSMQEGFGELFFWTISRSETWSDPTLREWMKAAGLSSIRRSKVLSFPGTLLLTGSRAP